MRRARGWSQSWSGRAVAVALAVASAVGFASVVAGPAAGASRASAAHRGARTRAHRYPARLLVYAQEWSLSPSRATLPAGRVIVQLWNRGMDAHDLRARRLNAAGSMVGHTYAVRLTQPGHVHSATWTLAPGRYQLYCSLPGHMARGMRVRITVRRDRRQAGVRPRRLRARSR